jgi:phosphoribosylformylglycinamidine synthase
MYPFFRQISNDLELGFYVETSEPLSKSELETLKWLIAETFEPDKTGFERHIPIENVVEIGPRLAIETPFSSNAVSICQSMNLSNVTRLERSFIYSINENQSEQFILANHLDKMVEQRYQNGITTFDTGITPEEVEIVDVIGRGKAAIEEINKVLGLGMDKYDVDYYNHLFANTYKRNPTDVELFQIGNANSEHCRHWFFKGQIVIDGKPMEKSLLELVQGPLKCLNGQNRTLKAFNDDAGVLGGFETKILLPRNPGSPSEMALIKKIVHFTCTAETHNHPTGVSPYGGGATGAGGRIRDNKAVGKGGILGVGAAGYSVCNLFIPGYQIPGEVAGKNRPSKYASPLSTLIEGSNSVSDYGNQIGEPLTLGYLRTFGQIVREEWRGYRKPILYTGGVGGLLDENVAKEIPEIGMHIVRIGGPAYPIGVGGGSASSMQHGENTEALDFNSVQRGNAEMENRANRVLRSCAEMGKNNPISNLHDQGAGGPSNVLTELLEPLGGTINIRNIVLGDKTMPVLKIWSAEFQEGYGLLIRPENLKIFQSICERERVNCEVLGKIDGNGKVVVIDSLKETVPVNLGLEEILTKIPRKIFRSERQNLKLKPLDLSEIIIPDAIEKVLKLPSVGSKGFLVHKVDRSVTGLVAQQQTCGIAQIAISDVSVNAQSHFGFTGSASSIGEQPIKMLVNTEAGSRMTIGEMYTNMAPAKITDPKDIRVRLNWMAPAKLPHEGAILYDAAVAATDLMIELGIACDGGKDSASMASEVCGELVKAPTTLVVLGYAPMEDIRKKITPDIKNPGESLLALIDLGKGKNRLGGSALAQAYTQLGDECPDVDDPVLLKNAFAAVQQMVDEGVILSVHDRSDGGLFTTVTEMCMASRCGFKLELVRSSNNYLAQLFSEELGFVLELSYDNYLNRVLEICKSFEVPISLIGMTTKDGCSISGKTVLWRSSTIAKLRYSWESISSKLEEIQMNPDCAKAEHDEHQITLPGICMPHAYHLTFTPTETLYEFLNAPESPNVAIIREEGTNGDREMQAACLAGGLIPWDVTMSDLLEDRIDLKNFRMIIFAGGFSYMDVFDSAKGWAGTILFNEKLRKMFDDFCVRPDTLSLGVCNGCQLMALLGWVPLGLGIDSTMQPRFIHNVSSKFESRWVQVEVLPSPSVLLKGMVGSKLGVWVANAEGKLVYPDESIQSLVEQKNLTTLAYVDPYGKQTEKYPYSPNGSSNGRTALCSPDGRHNAMMPHPERCFQLWQLPWIPASWKNLEASPWLRMFQNARTWLVNNKI